MATLQCKKLWTIPERFCDEVHEEALYKCLAFTFFTFILPLKTGHRVMGQWVTIWMGHIGRGSQYVDH